MLQFGPRLGVRASTRPSIASIYSIETNKPGKHRAGFLTIVVVQTRKQDHFEQRATSGKRFKLETVARCPEGHGDECAAGTETSA